MIRVYADTSVFGGAFDPEFEAASRAFFERVRCGAFELVVSPLVLEELESAPEPVQRFRESLEPVTLRVDVDQEAYDLQQAYLDARVVSARWDMDALHVAVASVAGCRILVSWNFQHIVNYKRIPLYNAVNQIQGYAPIAIHTPQEVLFDDESAEEL